MLDSLDDLTRAVVEHPVMQGASPSQPTASDCLVIDVQMPGMSGLDVQQRVAQTGRGVPIIFMTAIDDEQVRDQAWRAGAVAYFRKPLDGPALLDTIAFALCRTIS